MANNDFEQINVHLTTKVCLDNEVEEFSFDTLGQLIVKNEAVYIRYTETLPDQPQVHVTFKFDPNGSIRLMRSGDVKTVMTFVDSKEVPASYETPSGRMTMATRTTLLATALDTANLRGETAIDYILTANEQLIGQYEIRLQFNA
ncbi:DUF1934 domain-containing protein [Leuconostoc fallax]|uniref:DUF1934 domain-containing protein n=1 Tax=Leuconostoc fallax TaxID=1251 RepID=A0A4R5NB40_9LACO|nr:DUF1934 domain-containing protein [Leuconostoc fallax]MBU7455063.1 DUF1934 domain-containing protein [Leuconostoc fallax]MCO6183338.1 DUF1934 domain-containing protein [Leuconostoc fallax]TDG69628.1 hypothetical protein C5L23_001090 [Leuconostoc fallax]